MTRFGPNEWALILGGSSGFGLASARKLASEGMSVCVVHRDRRGAMDRINAEFDAIRACGHGFVSLNLDALAPEAPAAVLEAWRRDAGADARIRVLLHSIAYGNLKPIVPSLSAPAASPVEQLASALGMPTDTLAQAIGRLAADGEPLFTALESVNYGEALLDDEDMARTIYSMGTSMLTWVQRLHAAGAFGEDARVIGLTSEGQRSGLARLRSCRRGQSRRSNRCRERSPSSSRPTGSGRTSSSPA